MTVAPDTLPEPWVAAPFLARCEGLDAEALGEPPLDDNDALKRWLRRSRRARTAELARRNLRGTEQRRAEASPSTCRANFRTASQVSAASRSRTTASGAMARKRGSPRSAPRHAAPSTR